MYLPLGFETEYERRPWVTWALLVALTWIFFGVDFERGDGTHGGWALVPEDFRLVQLVSSSFLHVDVVHLAGNLLFLWVFGRYVEDRLGWWRYLALFLGLSVAGDVAYLAFGPPIPSVGASGAISGLMGYVVVAAPWLEMRFMLTFGYAWSRDLTLACGWLIIPWLLWELLGGWLTGSPGGGVTAHVGGFAAGAAAAAVMRSRWCQGTLWYIDPRPPHSGAAIVGRLHEARGRRRA